MASGGMSIQSSSLSSEKVKSQAVSQGPFSLAQNIYLFFGGGDRGQIVEHLIRGIGSDDSRLNVIRYDFESVSAAALMHHLLIEISPHDADVMITLGGPEAVMDTPVAAPERSTDLALQRLWRALQSPLPNDRPYLLLIDANVSLDAPARALLGQLAALRHEGRSVIQIVLFENVSSINQASCVDAHGCEFWLRRLTLPEISDYLYHQMLLFDFNQRDLFSRQMAYFIAERSEGLFSRVNELACQALMFADLENSDRPSMTHLLMADSPTKKVEARRRQKFLSRHRGALIALFGLCVVVSSAVVVAFLG